MSRSHAQGVARATHSHTLESCMNYTRQYVFTSNTIDSLTKIERILRERLKLTPQESRPVIIVRRAIEAYLSHLEDMNLNDGRTTYDGAPITPEIRANFERVNVRRHLK